MKKVYKFTKGAIYYYTLLISILSSVIFAGLCIFYTINTKNEYVFISGIALIITLLVTAYLYFLDYRVEIDEDKMILSEKLFNFNISKISIREIESIQYFRLGVFDIFPIVFSPILFSHQDGPPVLIVFNIKGKSIKKKWYIDYAVVHEIKNHLLKLNQNIIDKSLESEQNPYEEHLRKQIIIEKNKLLIILAALIVIFIWIIFTYLR